ncbi:hypothetical protein APHAL10511_002892 [Amanita phalloides]|nr:hypothetical protein APHAL10511_002892 [Amanita phalloides]
MSDSNIQVGDEVSWNWGGGHPTGKVAEIQTSGKLEIESKGKRVHKNADEQNPAVRIGHSGDDVVKRASELNRLRGGGEGPSAGETVAQGGGEGEAAGEGALQGVFEKEPVGETAVQGGEGGITTAAVEAEAGVVVEAEEQPADEKPKRSGKRGAGRGKRTTAETRKKQSEAGKKGAAARKAKADERGQRKAAAEEAAVGEKRERAEEVETGAITTEDQEAEKEVKKAKVVA